MNLWQAIVSLFSPRAAAPPPAIPTNALSYTAELTHYGYPDDETPDTLTEEGWGDDNNHLQPGVIAIDPASRSAHGITDGDVLQITMADGTVYVGYVGDSSDPHDVGARFDVFDPTKSAVLPKHDGARGTVKRLYKTASRIGGTTLDRLGPLLLAQYAPKGSHHG